jgi:hypothetical protein
MRNFGVSSRPADGGIQRSGPHMRDAIHPRTNLITFPRLVSSLEPAVNSRAEPRESFIQVHEFATGFFLGCFVALVAVLFCIGFVGYRALIA